MFKCQRAASVAIATSLYLVPDVLAQGTSWELRSSADGERSCAAVKLGEAVNTRLLRNENDDLVLIASRGDWEYAGAALQAGLSIDDAEPIAITGYPLGPLFLTLVSRDIFEQVEKAKLLRWYLPWGVFSAEVEGLGNAFKAIEFCPE